MYNILGHLLGKSAPASPAPVVQVAPPPPPPPPPPVKPQRRPLQVTHNDEDLYNYRLMAEHVGVTSVELMRALLQGFFAKTGTFDKNEVYRYLTEKRKAAGKSYWGWVPLREQDNVPIRDIGSSGKDGYYSRETSRRYARAIPYGTLETVSELKKMFGDKVCVFVSDYPETRPDPFIMAASRIAIIEHPLYSDLADADMFIFDVWDEPSFGF